MPRPQLVRLLASVLAVYLVVFAVNALVLWNQTKTNSGKIGNLRTTVNRMIPGLHIGSRILDADLHKNGAVARVGEYYLTQTRFDQLAAIETAELGKEKIKADSIPVVQVLIMNRMITEPLVNQFAQDHHLIVGRIQVDLRQNYNLPEAILKAEVSYAVLQAKMEEALGGQSFKQSAKIGLTKADYPKVREYADHYARTHTNYLISGGYRALAKRLLSL